MSFLRGEKMKIAGSMNYVKFDLENGYVIKAEGEMLVGRKFVAYMDTMKTWDNSILFLPTLSSYV